MTTAICRTCGLLKRVDCLEYCCACYPYDQATDRAHVVARRQGTTPAKIRKEQRR